LGGGGGGVLLEMWVGYHNKIFIRVARTGKRVCHGIKRERERVEGS